MRVHLTGAGGFLGSHVAAELSRCGHVLAESVEGADAVALMDEAPAGGLAERAEALVVDAARVLDRVLAASARPKRIVVAARADGYGEGPGECGACGRVRPENRTQMSEGEPRCPRCEGALEPVPVREDDRLQPATPLSALYVSREDLVQTFGRVHGIQSVSLRFFSLYGEGRTEGAIASLTSAARAGAVVLHEDGRQSRDFVHVADAVRAVCLALEHPRAAGQAFNVGTGKPTRISDLAASVAPQVPIRTGGRAPVGEARHLFSDPKKLQHFLGWRPQRLLPGGLAGAVR